MKNYAALSIILLWGQFHTIKGTSPLQKEIVITNKIEKQDTVYRKYCMNFYPDNFTIYVNGKQLALNNSITINNNEFTVVYSYEWNPPWGKIERAKEVTFQINKNTQSIDLHFKSWKDPYRLDACNARPLETKEIQPIQLLAKKSLEEKK